MRVPWIATLDALIQELNSHLDAPVKADRSGPRVRVRPGTTRAERICRELGLGDYECNVGLPWDSSVTDAIRLLLQARRKLETACRKAILQGEDPIEWSDRDSPLDQLDERQVRYPDVEGREGLASLVEKGGIFGPVLGKHIANVIRRKHSFKSRPPFTFRESWERRYAVKQVGAIQHLYAVGLRKATEMFCDCRYTDDPDARAVDRVLQWVKRDRKEAKALLKKGALSPHDEGHLKGILFGLHRDQPRGLLKGLEYPEGLEELRK